MALANRSNKFRALGMGLALLFLATGCTQIYHEELVRTGITAENAPEWAQGKLQNSPNTLFFVGRSVGYTVLDEAAAVKTAREDIYQQLSDFVCAQVFGRAENLDKRANGDSKFGSYGDVRTLPGRELDQKIRRELEVLTAGISAELITEDIYFEQWDVRDYSRPIFSKQQDYNQRWNCQPRALENYRGSSRGSIRYKCWLLMSIDCQRLQQRVLALQSTVEELHRSLIRGTVRPEPFRSAAVVRPIPTCRRD